MKKKTKTTVRELKGLNRVSEGVHGKMSRGVSNVRLSLTFRIAVHYAWQLIRSFLPVLILLTLIFSVAVSVPLSADLKRISEAGPDEDGLYSPAVIQNARLKIEPSGSIPEREFFPRLSQQAARIFSPDLLRGSEATLNFYVTAPDGKDLAVSLLLGDYLKALLWILLGAVLADLIRIRYFIHNRNRLNRKVLAPIRDITDMAATLSENNLSNRINIAGTKNELKDLAQVINTMLDRIEHSYNSQKQFVSDASHELRTPIAVIRGYTDMLKRWGKDDPEVLDEGINAISLETASMKDLVENLLFLARHDKKTLMMEMSDFDPAAVIEEVHREESMVDPNHTFTLHNEEHMLLNADRNMVKQVLRILTDNAIKYSPAGTEIALAVTRTPEGLCCLSVTDHGSGIGNEDLPKIFDRFYRADRARHSESGGHGLGLSIARIIVVAHKGQIKVHSKLGEGTSFSVLLPLK